MTELPSEKINIIRQQAYDLLEKKELRKSRELFEQIFDGKESAIATCLGFIHDQRGFAEHNVDEAIRYYRISASQGDVYAQHALAGLLRETGKEDEAISWYERASKAGNADCSYALYLLLAHRQDRAGAKNALKLAAEQGHPPATQKYALRCISGDYGIKQIFAGTYLYFKNTAQLVRYAKARVP